MEKKMFLLIFILCVIESYSQNIVLPEPATKGGMGLYDALSKRHSSRDFIPDSELSLEQLSKILWATYGANRPSKYKTAPSSKHKFPFDVYAFLPTGIYFYNITANQLDMVREGDYREYTGKQEFVKDAFLNLVLVSVLEREGYGDFSSKLASRYDSGFAAANALISCAAEELKCVPRAMFDQKEILDKIGLNQEKHYIPICISIGK